MTAYYNEIDPFAAQWLRNLEAAGHIAPGFIDQDDINLVELTDMFGFDQCHFFAGIGVWSHALRKAGWPDNVPVWTGSCPCQPFSTAGRRGGFDDERHLWPRWFELIEAHRPPVIMGEQVASPDGLAWLDSVLTDLERAGYSVRATNMPAASVGAPHIRQRLYFVALTNGERRERLRLQLRAGRSQSTELEARRGSTSRGVGDTGREGGGRNSRSIPGAEAQSRSERVAARDLAHQPESSGAVGRRGMGDSERARLARRPRLAGDNGSQLQAAQRAGRATSGFWEDVEWLPCADGKARPTQPGIFPLADGVPVRVGRLRAAGNAIVADVAATVIRALMDVL